ncbi:hypothetical protein BAE44_0006857 [Dichanthelium oligosanthes]|uniref:Osmotin-like protein n=1 Tax=Dichanthelium oligosanthes TaxID=888268 RepID=A0A1E5W412_9POAL|nr:hypothetical protein BAE44_0006857 [Dichanthelium oligosanthes]
MAAMSSLSKKTLQALMMTSALTVLAAGGQASPGASTTTANLTLHNLCPYPVWPLVTANAGIPSIPTDEDGEPVGRLDGNGSGLATLAFPPGAWSGRVVARTGCAGEDDEVGRCETGDAPPVTVAQVSVGGPAGRAAYSVSLVDGFNVAVVVTPHGFAEGRRCPTLGCAVDLAAECPVRARAPGGGCGAGASEAAWFKDRCPDTRTNAMDVEATPQDCVAPGEIKVVFCPAHDSAASHASLLA